MDIFGGFGASMALTLSSCPQKKIGKNKFDRLKCKDNWSSNYQSILVSLKMGGTRSSKMSLST